MARNASIAPRQTDTWENSEVSIDEPKSTKTDAIMHSASERKARSTIRDIAPRRNFTLNKVRSRVIIVIHRIHAKSFPVSKLAFIKTA